MGPGPSNISNRVLKAMSCPVIGHLDPQFLELMNQIQGQLRRIFRTSNRLTIPISGTGSAGMEAAVLNFVSEGDPVLVCINGVFGMRLAEVARRAGARCETVSVPFGHPLDLDAVRQAARKHRPRVIAMVHAETSTGVLQSVQPVREICDEIDALLLVDAVTSLGGHPVLIDEWKIDICYSGTQKCLSCPPGLAPVTVSPRAEERLKARTQPCRSWYLDLSLVQAYWGSQRTYHHTAPISMNYGLFEALRIIEEEGLEARWDRHKKNHQALVAGLGAMGLKMAVDADSRLWSLNAVCIPEGIDDQTVRAELLSRFNLEIGGGLGELNGKIWRVGLMGETSRAENVLYFLHALGLCLQRQGYATSPGAGLAAAAERLDCP